MLRLRVPVAKNAAFPVVKAEAMAMFVALVALSLPEMLPVQVTLVLAVQAAPVVKML